MKLAEHPRPWKVVVNMNKVWIVDANGKQVRGDTVKIASHIVACVNTQAVRDR